MDRIQTLDLTAWPAGTWWKRGRHFDTQLSPGVSLLLNHILTCWRLFGMLRDIFGGPLQVVSACFSTRDASRKEPPASTAIFQQGFQ